MSGATRNMEQDNEWGMPPRFKASDNNQTFIDQHFSHHHHRHRHKLHCHYNPNVEVLYGENH